jgi:hypothetical protein
MAAGIPTASTPMTVKIWMFEPPQLHRSVAVPASNGRGRYRCRCRAGWHYLSPSATRGSCRACDDRVGAGTDGQHGSRSVAGSIQFDGARAGDGRGRDHRTTQPCPPGSRPTARARHSVDAGLSSTNSRLRVGSRPVVRRHRNWQAHTAGEGAVVINGPFSTGPRLAAIR